MRDLTALFEPRGVAIIGASSSPEKLGHAMAASLDSFAGPVRLVNPRPGPGMDPTIAAAAEHAPIDLAVLCIPAQHTAQALRDSAAAGVGAALVCAGGFAEIGDAGLAAAAAVDAAIRDTGIRVLGPNTSGFFVPADRLVASFVPGARELGAGRVAVVAASGGINHVLSFQLEDDGAGVSLGVGLGAGQDITAVDVLRYLRTHEPTTAVVLHLETVPDGRALLDAVDALAREKPVVALVIGQSDVSEFAQSHTGALATSWRTTRALLRQAGAVLVDSEEQAVAAASALAAGRAAPSRRPGIGLVTAQAGPGLLIADALGRTDDLLPPLNHATLSVIAGLLPPLTFQANPVDTGRPGPGFGAILEATASDPAIDVLGVYAIIEPVVDLATSVSEAGLPSDVPVVVGIDGPGASVRAARRAARALGVTVLRGPTRLAEGLAALTEDARLRAVSDDDVEPAPAVPPISWRGPWDEVRGKQLLDDLGVHTPPRRHFATRREARSALDTLSGPLAVKLVDAEVLHKTEIGGVVLGIRTQEQLDAALDQVEKAGARSYLVEEMAGPGVELIVGARNDPAFGPTVVLGLGGTTAEVLADVTIRSAPLSATTAEAMLDDLAGAALLRGHRGGPSIDSAGLGRLLVALGGIIAAGHVDEIEINPLRLTSAGLVALDAVVRPLSPAAHDEVRSTR
ncbi:acetate--CoA ligase family protein [Rathayibacter caricis]|uniref:acetate--CoA ligase family protein n=1 Tax=Rathayibacter caricis TaxID=110936 RepID=UPI001FB29DC7|nr:acetate--CoA ligase family protein [Rathayibacter caricis]MCJ1697740.1 acetate--CoA ligase family protein [Rathayibacter caricis]